MLATSNVEIPRKFTPPRQAALHDKNVTINNQRRKPLRPERQVSIRKPTNLRLQPFLHIVVVVLLIPQRPEQVHHSASRVLALFTQRVDKALGERGQEVHPRANDIGSQCFQVGEFGVGGWWAIAGRCRKRLEVELGLVLIIVGYGAQEVEAVFGGPEKGMKEDG